MRKHILTLLGSTAVAICGIDTGSAADIPVKAARPAAAPVCAAAQFQGFYIGVSGGGAYHQAHRGDSDGFLTDNSGWTLSKWGGIAGGQAGYNWTTCSTVWGVEVDGSWVGVKNTFREDPNGGEDHYIRTKVNALFTARLRTGVVLDNLLLYVTSGVAGARIRTTWANAEFDPPNVHEFKEWRWGWTAGFGTEWAWTAGWSLKSEVLYVAFADRDRSANFGCCGGDPFSFRHSDNIWVSRIGLNYRWGGAPLLARY